MYAKILVPTDGSASAQRAVEEAVSLAQRLGSEITFLYALEFPLAGGAMAAEALPYSAQLWEDLKNVATVSLKAASDKAAEAGVRSTAVTVENRPPVQAILDAEADHDLVVMGTHGRRGFNRWMFGSVAEGALRRAKRPFLLVRSPEEEL